MKKRILSFFLAAFLLVSLCSGTAANDAADVPLTRAEAINLLWQAAGSPEPAGIDTPFCDLDGSPYREAIVWAVEKGITNGVSRDRFAPDEPVTRMQAASFLYREAGEPGKTGEGAWYRDAAL